MSVFTCTHRWLALGVCVGIAPEVVACCARGRLTSDRISSGTYVISDLEDAPYDGATIEVGEDSTLTIKIPALSNGTSTSLEFKLIDSYTQE